MGSAPFTHSAQQKNWWGEHPNALGMLGIEDQGEDWMVERGEGRGKRNRTINGVGGTEEKPRGLNLFNFLP